jgi:uncharacterized UBP type Zn finger protein
MEMGFGLHAAQRAAIMVNNIGVENAVEWCFAHSEDPDFNDPIEIGSTPPVIQNTGQAHSSTDDEPVGQTQKPESGVGEGSSWQDAPKQDVADQYCDVVDSYVGTDSQSTVQDDAQAQGNEQTEEAGDAATSAVDDKENVAPSAPSEQEGAEQQEPEQEAESDASPSPSGSESATQSPSALGPVPTYSPPRIPANEYVAPETGTLDGATAHEHVRPDADSDEEERNQSGAKRRKPTAPLDSGASEQLVDDGTAVVEINPAYIPGTAVSPSPPPVLDLSAEVAQLVEMGFPESACIQALKASAGDVSAATQRLLSGSPAMDSDGDSTGKRVEFTNVCKASSTCKLGCETVSEHMAATKSAALDEFASSAGGLQPQPPVLPKPNQRRPRRTGRPELTRPQKEQIQTCIQVLVQKKADKRRPPWHEKMEQLRAMEDGESHAAEYQETYSQMIAGMADVMLSLLRVATGDPAEQSEPTESHDTGGEVSVDAITVDGSDDPTLQQFIDRVNAALKERDDSIGAAPEPETFHDLCVQLGIDMHENYLAMNSVDTKEQLQMLASHGLGKSDCEEIGLNDQQRDSILQWAKKPVCGLKVASVSIERQALWHPIVYNTSSNLPRDLRHLLNEAAENGIADLSEVKIDVQFEDVSSQPADGPNVSLRLGKTAIVTRHASTNWICLWLEKLLNPDANVYHEEDGNPALRDLALRNMTEGGGVQTILNAVTMPDAFPGWETLFRAQNLLYAIEEDLAVEHVDALKETFVQNYRTEMPSSVGVWRFFVLCMSMIQSWTPHFDVQTVLAHVVEEMPAQTLDACVGIYRHAQRQDLHDPLMCLMREALSEARLMVASRNGSSDADDALTRERSAEKLTKQRSKLEEKDATLSLLVSEGIEPGTLASEVEEIKTQIDDTEAEISRAAKVAEAADTVEALLVRVNRIVNGIPEAGAVIGKDEEWFMCLLDVVRLPPASDEYSVNDVRNIAWSLLKHAVVSVPRSIEEQLHRFEIDWEGDLFLTIYELHVVHKLLTATANPAWKRGFIREHNHVVHFLNFVRSLDLGNLFLCNIVLNDVFGIFQYCVDQLVHFTEEEISDEAASAPASAELQQLMNMGFPEDKSAAMLLKCHNRLEVAATHLMDASEPDSSDFSSDEDEAAAELQRSVSVSSASVLRVNLLGDDDGAALIQQLCSMMRKSYDCHVAMKSERMADTLLTGMAIIITMLKGNISGLCSEPDGAQMVAVLEAGVCSLVADSEDKAVRISASECLQSLCDLSEEITATVYRVIRRGEFKPPPAACAQYFKVLLHMLRKQPTVRPMLADDMLDFVYDWETSLDNLATLNHIKLLQQVLRLEPTLIPASRAMQLSDVLCDRYLLSAPDPPIFRREATRENACKLLQDLVDTYKSQQCELLLRLATFVRETPAPPWNYTSSDDRFDQLVRHTSGLAGLTNKGNTCYMNSSLQQLYALPELREAITHDTLLPAVFEGGEGIRVRVKNKAKFLAERKVSVRLISVHPEESMGFNSLQLCEGLGYVTGRQEAEVTLASTSKTNTSSFSQVIPAGQYTVVITDSEDEALEPLLEIALDLIPAGTRKANYTLELSGETTINCNASLKALPRALQRCMFQLQHSKTAVFDTGEVCNACEELQEFSTLTLEGGIHRQHDAAEFVGVLLEYLEDEMPDTNLLARLKGFFTRTVVTLWFPKDAGHENTVVPGATEESFGPFGPVDISAKSTGGTLEECMQDSVSAGSAMNEDIFTGLEVAEGWTTATRTQVIKVLPRVLVMSLGRFKYNMATGRTDKLNYKIEFPQDLDMSPYTETYIMADREGTELPEKEWFELVGVITHQGTASAGHYFSYAKHNSKWFKLNDERVAESTIEALEKECFGNGVSNTNAYMLVYRAKDVGGEDMPEVADDDDAAEKAAMKAKMAASVADADTDVVADDADIGRKAGGIISEEPVGLTRTSTLSKEVDTENEALLRQAELFDDDVINLMLRVSRMYLRYGTEDWSREIPDEHRQLVWTIGLDVLSRVLARWKNVPKTLIDVHDWVELLRMAVRPDPWSAQVPVRVSLLAAAIRDR